MPKTHPPYAPEYRRQSGEPASRSSWCEQGARPPRGSESARPALATPEDTPGSEPPRKLAVAAPSTCSRSGGIGSDWMTVVIITRIGASRSRAPSRSLDRTPPATGQAQQSIRPASVVTPVTAPFDNSIERTFSPRRNTAPWRFAARWKAATVACGSACPSVGQKEAARTVGATAGAISLTSSMLSRSRRSSPARCCVATISRMISTSGSVRARRRLPFRR